jgi:hypothetical protein
MKRSRIDRKTEVKLQTIRLKAAIARSELELKEAQAELDRQAAVEAQRRTIMLNKMATDSTIDWRRVEIPRDL